MFAPRISLAVLSAVVLLSAGCAGPEKKLGRGINNATELLRQGELRHSMEQTMLWEGNDRSYTKGFFKGFNKSVQRTLVGAYEIVTFPFPGYDSYLKPEDPIYPDNHKPQLWNDAVYETDTNVGFSGGAVAPWMPNSRFSIFGR